MTARARAASWLVRLGEYLALERAASIAGDTLAAHTYARIVGISYGHWRAMVELVDRLDVSGGRR